MDETKSEIDFQTGHVGLNVRHLETSKKFYQEVFGFEIMGESKDQEKFFAFLGKGGKIFVTLWQQSDTAFNNQTAGLHHLSFQVNSIEEVKNMEKLLKDLDTKFQYEGIVPHREGSSSGGIFFEDPDGIRLEIFTLTEADNNHAPNGETPSCGFF
jgi:catechol-2,3-dioxygenase